MLIPHAALVQRRAGNLSNTTDGRSLAAGVGLGMLFDDKLTDELGRTVPVQERGKVVVGMLCNWLSSLDMADGANGRQKQKLNMM